MKRSERLTKELEKIKNELRSKLDNIKNAILSFDKVKRVSVGISGWTESYIQINITPESAWTDVMRIEIYKDKNEFHTSSGGWNDETKALEEFAIITNQLLEFVNTFNPKIIDELAKLDKRIVRLQRLVEKAENLEKIRKQIKDKRKLTEEEIQFIMRTVKDGKEYIIFTKTRNGLMPEKVAFYRNRYRLTDFVVTKKELEDILKRAYIHN